MYIILLLCITAATARFAGATAWQGAGASQRFLGTAHARTQHLNATQAFLEAIQPLVDRGLHDFPVPDPHVSDNCQDILQRPHTRPNRHGQRVPDLVHMVWGLGPSWRHEGLGRPAYYAVHGAQRAVGVERVVLHRTHPIADTHVLAQLQSEGALGSCVWTDFDTIMGRNISMYSHKSDVIRILTLFWAGGVYVDTDLVLFRSLADLQRYAFVAGEQTLDGERSHGIATCVLLSEPQSVWVGDWVLSYHDFDWNDYDLHSIRRPTERWRALVAEHGEPAVRRFAKVFPIDTLVYPPINMFHLFMVDRGTDAPWEGFCQIFSLHLWLEGKDALRDLTHDDLLAHRSEFGNVVCALFAQGELCASQGF
ncbi:unnamed protein product [Pedinophyceae sp. YPF-701]|nr:unnamed protein product [Pedinophyceae sp. YPF-701]